jgi:hypothetical protein
MSNKTQLQTNNSNLDALIARVNIAKDTAASLPEAGGGSVETCTVQFSYMDYLCDTPGVLYYTKPDLTSGQATYQASRDNPLQPPSSVTVLKNSIVVLTSTVPPEEFWGNLSGDCEPLIESFIGGWAFRVNGDCAVYGTNG